MNLPNQQKVRKVIELLKLRYPNVRCELVYRYGYELMIAARLSAQCRDERVNLVTKKLFAKYATLEEFGFADYDELAKMIRPCGLFKVKASDIIGSCKMLMESFGGEVPGSLEQLVLLPGVGRKTANLLLGEIWNEPAIVCDTHVIRITNRLGVCNTSLPKKVERTLRILVPPEESASFCHRLVKFGRDICVARSPRCEVCELFEVCAHKI